MQSLILSIIAFFVAIGVLVTIHEFGHYWMAKKMGVKVLRFSIGFGKPLWKKVAGVDKTEYVLAAIPLGGYVKMLDEREGNVPAADLDRSFNRKSVWARIAIVLAGPLANLILAVVFYWLLFIVGITGIAPIVGSPIEGSQAAKAGFQAEDRIVEVNGKATPTWNTVYVGMLDGLVSSEGQLNIAVTTKNGSKESRTLLLDKGLLKKEGDIVGSVGLSRWWPEVDPIIGGVEPRGAAVAAGLTAGDKILSSDGVALNTWRQFVDLVRSSPDKTLNLMILRDGTEQSLQLTPKAKETETGDIGFIGARETQSLKIADEKLRTVERYSPLSAIGMAFVRTGDMISVSLKMIGKLFTGEASLKNTVSGPISIAQYAGQSVSVGADHYLNFIALLSISLGIFNLFPVPMLDGGHLMYYLAEIVTGKQVSERVQLFGQQIGLALLGTLMVFVFYQDILRVFT